jgi:HEAT repeat protein
VEELTRHSMTDSKTWLTSTLAYQLYVTVNHSSQAFSTVVFIAVYCSLARRIVSTFVQSATNPMAPAVQLCAMNNSVLSSPKGSLALSYSHPNLDQLSQLVQLLQLNDGIGDGSEAAAEEFAHLTRKPTYRSAIMDTPGAVASIVKMLADQGPVARHAAAALQNLAIEPEHCTCLVKAGCMEPLLQLLHVTDDQEALLAAAAGALSNLAYEDKHCTMIAAAAGCVQRLVQLLSHSSCVVREAAASVLGKLAWEPELCEPIAGEQRLAGLVEMLLFCL